MTKDEGCCGGGCCGDDSSCGNGSCGNGSCGCGDDSFDGWTVGCGGEMLEREFKFEDFKEALDFVNKIGKLAEKKKHHPDIVLFDYNKVRLFLTTHDEGGITDKDYEFAEEADKIYEKEKAD